MSDKRQVLFVCVHNAGRSQIAAAFLQRLAGDRIDVRSAGTTPADEVNPLVVEAMATWPELQRRGLGSRVLSVVNDHIASIYELGALDTGSPSFYERSGWIRWRGPTSVRTDGGDLPTPEEDGNVMVLLTSATMDLDLDGPISCEWRPGDVW